MSDPESGRASAPDPSAAAEANGDASVDAAAEAPAQASEPSPLDVAKAEAAKYREQLLRTAADFDNFRKRSRREVEDALRKGKEQSIKDLLPVFDNMERAVTSAEAAPDVKSVIDGLRMVNRQFVGILERIGVKRVATVGHPFDPTQHEAIQHVDSSEHGPGVVAIEVQPGYLLGDLLLRAAMVAVSKGAPASEEKTDPGSEAPAVDEPPAES